MPYALHAGARLYWRADGDPALPPLVLGNSLGTDHCLWDPVMPRLADFFRVIRMDMRGHGASDAPDGEYTVELLAKDVLAVADAAGIERFAGILRDAGIPVTVRYSRGVEIAAACGQLRAEHQNLPGRGR